jgi:hypothetical protein
MKTKSLNTLLNHKFFLYGMVFLSTIMVINFFRNNSLTCLGVFGVAYYVACLNFKNKGLCLLAAIVVSTILFGCENNIEGLLEGVDCDPDTEECDNEEGFKDGVDCDPDTEECDGDSFKNKREGFPFKIKESMEDCAEGEDCEVDTGS